MNQILYVQGRTKKISEIKKIIKVFSVLIAVFGIILIIEGGYSLFKSIEHNKLAAISKVPPTVEININDNDIEIKACNDKVISKIEYYWGSDTTMTIEGNGRTEVSEKISLPTTSNILHVKAIDVNNNVTQMEKNVEIKNDIKLSVLNNNQIKINAQDNNGILNISYKWNNDSLVVINADKDSKNVEQEIDIPVGLNTLEVTMTNLDGETSKKSLDVKGVTKPEIKVDRDGEYIIVKVTDEEGLVKIIHQLNNGEEKSIPVDGKTITYKQKLIAGENNINIKAYNKNDIYTEYDGKCNF